MANAVPLTELDGAFDRSTRLDDHGPEVPAAESRVRLELHSQASRVVRLHVIRSAIRAATLIAADTGLLLLLRAVIQGVRDDRWLGGWLASMLQAVAPAGALPSEQIGVAIILGLAIFRNYGPGDDRRDASRLMYGAGLGVLMSLWPILWGHVAMLAVPLGLILGVAAGLAFVTERSVVDSLIRTIRSTQVSRAIVIGPVSEAAKVVTHPVFSGDRLFSISAFIDPAEDQSHDLTATLGRLIVEHEADTIILSGTLHDGDFEEALDAAAASRCKVLALPRRLAVGRIQHHVMRRDGITVVELTRPTLLGIHLAVKRIVDLAVVGIALPMLTPVMGAVALAVRLSSPGPILFRQVRIGQGGRRFEMLKFRTMNRDAEAHRAELLDQNLYPDRRLFKMLNDPRVTRVGAFLRRTSLDELPQLLNVLRGDMSLVGPRPPLPSEVELYERHHYTRFDVRPGITGPWQVGGRNLVQNFEDVISVETAYIRTWSLWLDFQLLLRTIPAVLSRRGAA